MGCYPDTLLGVFFVRGTNVPKFTLFVTLLDASCVLSFISWKAPYCWEQIGPACLILMGKFIIQHQGLDYRQWNKIKVVRAKIKHRKGIREAKYLVRPDFHLNYYWHWLDLYASAWYHFLSNNCLYLITYIYLEPSLYQERLNVCFSGLKLPVQITIKRTITLNWPYSCTSQVSCQPIVYCRIAGSFTDIMSDRSGPHS